MANKDLVKMAIEAHQGYARGDYSVNDSLEVMKNALVELNGGKTSLDIRAIRDGECKKIFTLIEEIITKTVVEGLPESSPIFDFVEYRNLKLGDDNIFKAKKEMNLVVSEIANGTQALRRQRLGASETTTVNTSLRGVKIYEELNRVLAGRIDFNEMIDEVSEAFKKQITEDIVTEFKGLYEKVAAPYQATGSFDEETLAGLIDHVEAATGLKAYIMGSAQAVRKITGIVGADSNTAKEQMFAARRYANFGVNPIIALENGHKAGTDEFILDSNTLYVVAADDKFIKFVTKGETLVIPGSMLQNADLSQEYFMGQEYGVGFMASKKFGVYKLA